MKQSFLDKVLGRNKPKMDISTHSKKKPLMLASSVNDDELTIDLIGFVGDWWENNTAEFFLELLNENKGVKVIHVKIHSLGGFVEDGIAMYNALLLHGAIINITVIGIAGSIASLIAMAGDNIAVMPASFVMIHNSSGHSGGTAEDLEQTATQLRKINDMAANIYAKRTGLSLEQIVEMMGNETWMTAEEALQLGFADKILPELPVDISPKMQAAMDIKLPFATLDHFEHVPAALMSVDKLQEKIIDPSPITTSRTTMTTQNQQTVQKPQAAAAPVQQAAATVNQQIDDQAGQPNENLEIIQLCKMSGEKPQRALDFIEAGTTAADVRATLCAEKNKEVADIPDVNSVASDQQVSMSGKEVSTSSQPAAKKDNPLLDFATSMNSKNKHVG